MQRRCGSRLRACQMPGKERSVLVRTHRNFQCSDVRQSHCHPPKSQGRRRFRDNFVAAARESWLLKAVPRTRRSEPGSNSRDGGDPSHGAHQAVCSLEFHEGRAWPEFQDCQLTRGADEMPRTAAAQGLKCCAVCTQAKRRRAASLPSCGDWDISSTGARARCAAKSTPLFVDGSKNVEILRKPGGKR